MSPSTFAELGVLPVVVEALARRDVIEPFPIQSRVLGDALAGRDVLVQSPTGSGKTLAFGIPLVQLLTPTDPPASALVLVPTRELASQVAQEIHHIARARGVRVARAYGGVSIANQARLIAGAQILVATPGRLEDLLCRRDVRLDRVRALVLDEADRMLDMGFLPQVEAILRRVPSARQTMLFSATLQGLVGSVAEAHTRDAVRIEAGSPPSDTGAIEHRFLPVTADGRFETLCDLLVENREGRTLVFVRTRHGADRLVQRLKRAGLRAGVMHGSKTQSARERALAQFSSGELRALVATDVAARGIDVDDITHVINFDPPHDTDGYVHRVGRTGRAGKSGTGMTLVLAEDTARLTKLAEELQLEDAFEADGLVLTRPERRPVDRFQRRSGGRRSRRR